MNREAFTTNEYYHIYNRGVDKRITFQNSSDYERFCALLFLCNSKNSVHISNDYRGSTLIEQVLQIENQNPLVAIGAWCLMPNHFHLLVKEIEENGISIFMKKLGTGYTMYFNIKNERTGSLFQGRFKSSHIDSDEYLKYMYSYIHLNPLKIVDSNWKEMIRNNKKISSKSLNFLLNYQYSSYLDYANPEIIRFHKKIITPNVFPEYFSPKKHKEEILDWLSIRQD